MKTYYFTYGWDTRFPFNGGWTRVIAPGLAEAKKAFRAKHPDKIKGIVNCAFMYSDLEWQTTPMFHTGTNRGVGEHEVIVAKIEEPIKK